MKCAVKKMRSPLKVHGGKSYLARRIIPLFPPHKTYLEPFLGGGSILLNKEPAEVEIAGDLDRDLIRFWSFLRAAPGIVAALASEIPYDEATFEAASLWLESEHPGCRAMGFLVRNRFSRGGLGEWFAWSDRLRGGQPGDVNAWETIRGELPAIGARVRNVEFYPCDAIRLIQLLDSPVSLIYCDPPYLHETRTHRAAYAHEMTPEQHTVLLRALLRCSGKVFLSGYRSLLYDEMLKDWTRHEFEMPNHSGQGKSKQRRVECLWESP